ncbi:MAG: RagB/SusD family nutrient uptake outer membrane protein, partial [Gemmatimonadetes bacterium]|nr:RagB/SusD family nutrient uptake outer membrane protein [Gemmatimonadota bacterium]
MAIMNTPDHRARGLRRAGGILAAALLFGVTGCEEYMEVTNPGPIQDEFLDDPQAHAAMVNGMGRALSAGINWVAYTGAAVTREIHPSGSTGSFGITNRWQQGFLEADDTDLDTHWEQAQRARWLAENGISRIEGVPESADLLPQAFLFAGYANRLLGENYCQAVIDGSAPSSHTTFLERAEAHFGEAIERGSGDVLTAAYAGRASVRATLGDWTGAVSDAGQVPDGFVYVIPYFDVGEDAQRNRIQWASHAQPYKAHTQWNTKYEDVGLSENNPDGDPRVPFRVTDEVGDAAISCCGNVAWWPQQKYADPGADIALSKGAEMRLIEAEAALRSGDWPGALAIINDVRADAGVDPVVATDADGTWTALKNERGIVLWLEGRRLGDMRRWDAES